MKRHQKFEIIAFYEPELKEILAALGLLENFNEGKLSCFFCGKKLTHENFGAIFSEQGHIHMTCSDSKCMGKLGG